MKEIHFPHDPNSELFIWPTELHILFHYEAMNILELLYPEIATQSMSMKFCSDSSQKPCSSLISPRASIVPSSYESYDHLRVSHHRCSLGWLCLVLLFIISMQGSLLHLCTNLAAWTTINQQIVVKLGTTSP